MTSQVPFAPLTPESFGRLTGDEQAAFTRALKYVAEDKPPSLAVAADLVLMVQRLIARDAAAEAELVRVRREAQSEREAVRADLGQLLDLLGLGDYARPESPHEVFQQCLTEVRRVTTELEHAKAAAAGSHEGVRLWMLDCGNLVQKHRERAGAAEAKLAAIETHCRKRIEDTSHIRYLPADPWDVSVSAGAVLAIISTGETPDDN